jgi:thioredoxin 1
MDWEVKELNRKNFFEEINQLAYPVFVDFWADWCPPCRMMHPVIRELAGQYQGKILFRKLNTDFYKGIAAKMNISGIPTYILFKDGKEIWRSTGAMSKNKIIEALSVIK